jgi:HlyD family secretion protein
MRQVMLPSKFLRLKQGLAVVVSALLGVSAAILVQRSARPELSSAEVAQTFATPVVQRVGAVGWIEPKGRVIRLAAPSNAHGARIERLLVNEGDHVQAGQIVAFLDSQERLQAALEESEKRVHVARARLAQVQAGAKLGDIAAQRALITRLQVELAGASAEYNRYHKLHESRAVSTSDFEHKRLARDTIAQEVERAKAALATLTEVRPVDVRIAQAELESAVAARRRAQQELNTAYVRASITGQVLRIHALPGELAREAGVLDLGQTEEMHAVAEVYESEIRRIKLGQRAIVKADALADDLAGEVVHIGLTIGKKDTLEVDPVADVDARVVEVRIRLDPRDSQRVSQMTNMRVRVYIQADER